MTAKSFTCPQRATGKPCACEDGACRPECLVAAARIARDAEMRREPWPYGPPRDYVETYGDEQRRVREEAGGLSLKTALAYVAVTIAGVGLGALIGWAIVQMVTAMAEVLAALVVGL